MNFFQKHKEVLILSGTILGVGILLYALQSFKKATKPSKSIVIGDSVSIWVSKNNSVAKVLSKEQSESTLWKSGINLNWLKTAVSKFPTSNEIGNVIVSIGANGGYNKNEDIKGLMEALKKTFSKADFYIVKGSWGWGNIKSVTEARVNEYYALFEKAGAKVIKTPVGKTDNPHVNLPVYSVIGKEIEEAIQ